MTTTTEEPKPTTALTLYEIEENLTALLDTEEMVEDPELRLQILDEIAQTHDAAVRKRENIIRLIRTVKLNQESITAEIDRLRQRKELLGRNLDRVEKYVVGIIEGLPKPKRGNAKLECPLGVLSIQKKPDTVEITDEDELPPDLVDVEVRLTGEQYESLLWLLDAEKNPLLGEIVGNRKPRKRDILKRMQTPIPGRNDGECYEVPGADLKFGENGLRVR